MDPLIQPYSNFSNYSSANSSLESQYVVLQFWTCFFINSRNSTFPTLLNKNLIFTCKLHVKYVLNTECTIAGAMVPCGFWICIGLTAVIIIFSNFGIFTNILNLLILPKSLKGSSVRRLMMLLAIFDLLASVCAIPTALLMIFILGRYETGYASLEAFRLLYLFFSLGRTGSIFTTIMISVERYIAIGYPMKQWLTTTKTRIHLMVVLVIVALVNLPWWLNKTVERNDLFVPHHDRQYNSIWSDLTEFPYIYKGTPFSRKVYPKMVMYHLFIDFAFPFPVLFIFNGLLYRSIYKANKARQTMTISQRREINATQTFCIVSIILLLCHGVAMAIFVTSQVYRELSRELQFCQILSVTFNASVNFLIYYALGKSFRDEFWKLTRACKLFRTKVELAAVTPSSSVNGTVEVGLSSVKVKSLRQLNSIPQSQRAYNTNEITNSSVK